MGILDDIEEYHGRDGALEFSFHECPVIDAFIKRRAIAEHLAALSTCFFDTSADPDAFEALPVRQVSEQEFFGSLWDPHTRQLGDPSRPHDGTSVKCNNYGGFCGAFWSVPHGYSQPDQSLRDVFDRITKVLVPEGVAVTINDWSSPQLVKLSPYFEAGAEWWGVHLYTIHQPDAELLSVISASATD
jgi:hypothetical protein